MKNSILSRLLAQFRRTCDGAKGYRPVMLLVSAVWFSLSLVASAAVSQLGTADSAFQAANGATHTFSYTVPAGTNRLLVVSASNSGYKDVSSVTFGVTPMIKAHERDDTTYAVDSIWYLVLGTSGSSTTANIVANYATPGGDTGRQSYLSAAVFSNVDQTTPVSGAASAVPLAAANVASSVIVSSAIGDLVYDLFDCYKTITTVTSTAGAGQTTITSKSGSILDSQNGRGTYSNSIEAGASSVTMSWTSDGAAMIHCVMNIKQAAAPAPTTVTSLNRVNTTPSNASFVNWTLTFASPVTGLTASNFTLGGAAATGSAVVSPGTSDGGLTWNVPVSTGSTDGTLTLSLANATGLTPGVSTSLPFTTAGQTYTMDKTKPTVTVANPSVSTIAAGAGSVIYAVTYADANFASSNLTTPGITLNKTGTADGTVGVSGSGTSYTVTISSITGVGTLGITVGANTSLDTANNANLASSASTTFAVTASGGGTVVLSQAAGSGGKTPVPVSNRVNGTFIGGVTYAQTFRTGSTATTLTKIQLDLAASDQINGSSQPLIVAIYNDTSGTGYYNIYAPPWTLTSVPHMPGSVISGGTLTSANPRPTVAGIYDFTGSVSLAANTTYWIVASSTDTVGVYNWNYDTNGSGALTTSGSGWTVDGTYASGQNAAYTSGFLANTWDIYAPPLMLFTITASAAAPTPTITVNPTSVALGTTTTGTAGTAQSFTVSGSNLTADIVLTAPTNVELSKDSGSTWQTSQTLTQSGGLVGNTTIQARIPASAIATTAQVSVTGNITSASTGATTQNVSVTGTVNPIPVLTINPTSQTLAHNQQTQQVFFTSTVPGTTYTWSNNNVSIGIGASGSGATIASFTATNTGSTPQTGTITVTPLANGVQGAQKTFTITVNPTTNVTINVPTGVGFTLNSVNYTGSQTVPLAQGSYTLSTTSPQTLGVGSQAVFSSWSDSGPISHSITVSASPMTITGSFTTQHQLTTTASPGAGGTLTPASGTFFDQGTVVTVSFTTSPGYSFVGWSAAATGSAPTAQVTMTAPRLVTANFAVAVPEIAVSYNSNNIADGSTTLNSTIGTDFGSTPVAGGVVENTYTITNSGTANLTLSGGPNFVSVDNPAFSVTLQPSGTIAPAGTTTFKIAFNPSALGSAPAAVSFGNNDSDENPFNFGIIGVGTGPRTFDLAGNPVSNTPFDTGDTYIFSVGPPPPVPISSAAGDVVTGGGAPNASGADSGADFDVLKRGGYLGENGMIVFPGQLLIGSGTPPVTLSPNTFMGLWKHDSTSLKLLARSGDPAPETGPTAPTSAKFDVLPQTPAINDSGEVTFLASLATNPSSTPPTTTDNDTGLWSELGGTGLGILIREGDVIPLLPAPPSPLQVGAFASGAFAIAHTSATTGEAAFAITIKDGANLTDTAILRTSVTSAAVTAVGLVARENATAPGTTDTFGNLAGTYSDPVRMDATGNLAFVAVTKPSGKEGLWYQPVAGATAKVFVAGDTAPGTSNATFKNIKSPAIGGEGTITFRGLLNADGDNAAGLKNDGIWRGTTAGGFFCILRRGDDNTNRAGLGLPVGSKVGNLWHSWLTNNNHGAWKGWLDVGGDGTSSTAAGDVNAIYSDLSGTMNFVLKVGDAAPGIAGATFSGFDLPVVGGVEQMAFIGNVTGGGTTSANNSGVWRSAPNGGALTLVIRTGDTMTTSQGVRTIQKVDFPGSGSTDRRWEQPIMDATGRLIVFVTFTSASGGGTSQILVP